MTKKIAVIGCGWLGFPLAMSLLKKGNFVKGSTTSQEKKKIISDAGIPAYLVSLSEESIEGEVEAFLESTDCIIINIPPKLRKKSTENYVMKIKLLIKRIKNNNIKKVLFISSTSVYYNDNNTVNEETLPSPETESGKQILEVEKLLQNDKQFKTTILRFGGLIGDDRHPVHFLSGRKNVKNPEAPINLIHLNDCIGIIEAIISKEVWGENFNASFPNHVTKENYYSQKAQEMNIAAPEFDNQTPSRGKTISSDKIKTILNYSFTTEV